MNMPQMSGIEVVKTIRFMDASHALPIIMLTADATTEAREASREAGADSFLTKPIDAKHLLARIAGLSSSIDKPDKTQSAETAQSAAIEFVPGPKSDWPKSSWYSVEVLNELAKLGGTEFVQELITNFSVGGQQNLARIKSALDNDYLAYREALHALKGSSVELGARRLAEICETAEQVKPYHLGSEKIKQAAAEVESAYLQTSTALGSVLPKDRANL